MKDLRKQAHEIAVDIVANTPKSALKGVNKEAKIREIEKKEIVAIIAYLQRMGTDIKVKVPNK
jgi:cbb3-type cytochrome oxidase cytochrome c subunit